jgi:spore germination protein YaaH
VPRLRGWGLLTALLVPLLLVAAAPARAGAGPVELGWNSGGSTPFYIARAQRAPGMNTVSPGWWMLQANGTIRDTGDHRYSDWAHARGLRVWPMFTNDIDQVVSHRVFTDAALRSTVIARVAALARAEHADGVNVDWEDVRTSDRDGFTAFLSEAAAVWREAGLVVSVDVTARTDTWQLGDWSESFDRAAVGRIADYVVLMAYDEHNRLRPLGSTASLPWVTESLAYLLRDVPASKVILGVPFYTQDWSSDPKHKMEVLTLADTAARLAAYHAVVTWNPSVGQSIATYMRNGFVHHVWVEDARSLRLKAALVPQYGLAGVAAWRIGFETPDAWRALGPDASQPAAPAATPAPTPVETAAPTPVPAPTVVAAPPVRAAAAHSSRAGLTIGALVLLAIAGASAGGAVGYRRRVRARG